MAHDKTQDFIDNLTQTIERASQRGPAPFGMPSFPGEAASATLPWPNSNMPISQTVQRPFQQFQGPPGGFGGGPSQPLASSAPSFMPQQAPAHQFGSAPAGFPPQGQMGGGGFGPGPGMSPQQSMPSFAAGPSMSPPGQGVGMQINPARAAALGLR